MYLNLSFELYFSCYQLLKKNTSIVLENLLFQKTNGLVAMRLFTFVHFIIYYVILTNHINFQMLKLETLSYIDFQSLILLNLVQQIYYYFKKYNCIDNF